MRTPAVILTLFVTLLLRPAAASTGTVATTDTVSVAGEVGTGVAVPDGGAATGTVVRSFLDDEPGAVPPKARPADLADPGRQLKGSVWRSLGATLLIIGLLLAANHWVRRRGTGFASVGRSGRLRIADRVPVDPRRGILLLEADGERIVVAVGTDRIETLAVLPRIEAEAVEEEL